MTVQQLTLADAAASSRALRDPNPHARRVRHDDHTTSRSGAASVSRRAGGQKAKLLAAFASAAYDGLTDEQAAERAGIDFRSCFWKRCGELRDHGLIQFATDAAGHELTRTASSGIPRKVSIITPLGLDTLAAQ